MMMGGRLEASAEEDLFKVTLLCIQITSYIIIISSLLRKTQ